MRGQAEGRRGEQAPRRRQARRSGEGSQGRSGPDRKVRRHGCPEADDGPPGGRGLLGLEGAQAFTSCAVGFFLRGIGRPFARPAAFHDLEVHAAPPCRRTAREASKAHAPDRAFRRACGRGVSGPRSFDATAPHAARGPCNFAQEHATEVGDVGTIPGLPTSSYRSARSAARAVGGTPARTTQQRHEHRGPCRALTPRFPSPASSVPGNTASWAWG